MSTPQQRALWRRQAAWLAQLSLTPDDPTPVDVLEEVANAVLALLDDVDRLERDAAAP
jgi:hypothetical protein